MARIVEIVPYDPNWPAKYCGEIKLIADVLGSILVAAHHIGSTAVPGLAAKPTIDILLVVCDLDLLDACNAAMAALGYQPKGENGIPGRRYFQKLAGEVHLFHIHAFKAGHPEITRHINFRDYLIAHPESAAEYQALKQELALRFRDAPAQYTSGKGTFIRKVDQFAAAWRGQIKQEPGDIQ